MALLVCELIAVGVTCYILSLNPVVGTAIGLFLGYVALRWHRK